MAMDSWQRDVFYVVVRVHFVAGAWILCVISEVRSDSISTSCKNARVQFKIRLTYVIEGKCLKIVCLICSKQGFSGLLYAVLVY